MSETDQSSDAMLRVGISLGQLSQKNPLAGVRQLTQNLSVEGLARLAEDGRLEPQLAEKWVTANDGRTLLVTLKPNVKFHDGSPVTAPIAASILPDALRGFGGPLLEDVEHIEAVSADTLQIDYRRASPLLKELLEVQIKKPGPTASATGPFMPSADAPTELRANPDYHLGRPKIERISIRSFRSVRAAWAELLRKNIDMLYEVGPDALDSLETSTSVSVFTFIRRYQHAVVFNGSSAALRNAGVRRAVNLAIDRNQLVREALNGHGIPSAGPIWPKYWALEGNASPVQVDPVRAAALLKDQAVRFNCLMPTDPFYERIALELKRQFAAVGVEMDLTAVSPDELLDAETNRKFDAVLTEAVSGPTVSRLYLLWHTKSPLNPFGFGNATVDAALETVRRAETEPEYRVAVAALERAFANDPPAIFLAWNERARAVSNRFTVPTPEPGRDVLATLRLWTPRNDERLASRN